MWKSIIQDLLNGGMTQQQIADYITAIPGQKKMSQAAVSDLLRGFITDPAHSRGEALLNLHARLIANKKAA